MKVPLINILSYLGMAFIIFAILSITIHFKCKPSDLVKLPVSDKVHINCNAIATPLNRFTLVRYHSMYGAIRFTDIWSTEDGEGMYENYESYFQDDGTGDFANDNTRYQVGELSWPKSIGIGRFAFRFGNIDVQCGIITLEWTGGGTLYFHSSSQKQGDYGIELAPTIWTDISQVDVFDKRIKWFRYDENRPTQIIPIDEFWNDSLLKIDSI